MSLKKFPWEYSCKTGDIPLPAISTNYVICIGLKGLVPKSLKIDDTYVLHIDRSMTEKITTEEAVLADDWGELLRLPEYGQDDQTHPIIKYLRTQVVTWVGNETLFGSKYELMLAASHYSPNDQFHIARIGTVETEAATIIESATDRGYHPMSGTVPKNIDPRDGPFLLSVLLGVLWYWRAFSKTGHMTRTVAIYENLASAFSGSTTVVIFAITYFGITFETQGDMQLRLNNYAELRNVVGSAIERTAVSLMTYTGSSSAIECADKLKAYFEASGAMK